MPDNMELLIKEQLVVELKMLPDLLEACIKKYIDGYDWEIILKPISKNAFTYTIRKERKK